MEKITNNKLGDFYMKKIFIIICIILGIIIIIPKDDDEFRIRVIANSDSAEDQKIKMKVVNALLIEIKSFDQDDIVQDIKNNIDKLDKTVEKVLGNKKYNLDIKKLRFPPKELNKEVVKGGKYMSLVVVIKDGKGKNWWSLLSPEFSKGFEDVETGDCELKFYFLEELKKGFK